ncbi:MAG: FAD-binding protein [Deltaproteobacteria bacterium]|nr:MAG: FAD-binding protein [Deltaproteobacteria bacterium]
MSRERIERQLDRLDRLFEHDPSNHDAIENTMEVLARLADREPEAYREVMSERGSLELVDPDDDTPVAEVSTRLGELGVADLPPIPDTFAGVRHAFGVQERARVATRPIGGAPILDRGVWFPHSRDSLARMLRDAGRKGCRVSCAGSWRSFSDVNRPRIPPRPGDLIFGTSFLNRSLATSGQQYRCEAGRAVWQITRDLHERDQALINMGGGDFQTLGGAVSTGTHGSGRTLGDLASFVREVEVCTLDANKEPVFRTLRGDELRAAGVALGALGVVYSAEFAVRERYHLLEKRLLMPWTEAKAVIANHLAGGDDWRHLEVLVIPYRVFLKNLRGKLYKRNLAKYQRAGDIPREGTLSVVTLRKEVPADTPSSVRQRPLSMRLARKGFGRWIAYQGLQRMVTGPQRIPDLLKSSMAGQWVDGFVGRWDEVLKLGLLIDASGAEFSVPAEQGVRAAEIILAAARDRLRGGIPRAHDEQVAFWKTRPMHTSPFALRFVKAGDAWLSMAHGRDSCMIEMPMLRNPAAEDSPTDSKRSELYRAYRTGRSALVDDVYGKLDAHLEGVRPHWGLTTPRHARGEAWARENYAQWDAWMDVYRQYNLHGTFNSAFTDRMGISVGP